MISDHKVAEIVCTIFELPEVIAASQPRDRTLCAKEAEGSYELLGGVFQKSTRALSISPTQNSTELKGQMASNVSRDSR